MLEAAGNGDIILVPTNNVCPKRSVENFGNQHTCHANSIVEDRGADARRLIGALEGGSCKVNANKALVWGDANCAVIVRALTKYAVAGSRPDIVAPSVLMQLQLNKP